MFYQFIYAKQIAYAVPVFQWLAYFTQYDFLKTDLLKFSHIAKFIF